MTLPEETSPITVSRGKAPFRGIILMAVIAGGGGVLVGALLYAMRSVSLDYTLSALGGFIVVTLFMALAVYVSKVRLRSVLIIAGLAIACITYSTYWSAKYSGTRNDWRVDLRDDDPTLSDTEIDSIIDRWLENETGSTGFWGFVKYEAQSGTEIAEHFEVGEDFEFLTPLTVGYWVFEFSLMAFGLCMGAYITARSPFCEESNRWLKTKSRGTFPVSDINQFRMLLDEEKTDEARQLIQASATKGKHAGKVKIKMGRCHEHAPQGQLHLAAYSTWGASSHKLEIAREEYNAWLDTIERIKQEGS